MKLFGKTLGQDFLLISEIGINHEGSLESAKKLIRLAYEAGADAVKIQSYTVDRYASNFDIERKARVAKFALSLDEHKILFKYAQELGCHLFSTPLTEDWVDNLNPYVSAFKVASGDLTFKPVIQACIKTGKPLLLSTGASTLEEVRQSVGWVSEYLGKDKIHDQLVLLHCVAAYPAPLEEANLNVIKTLHKEFGVHVGYSNHVMGSMACIGAAFLGAAVFEVHFTDQREGKVFRDHALSFEPEEFSELKKSIAKVRSSLGTGEKKVLSCEKESMPMLRKGVIAWREIKEGQIITKDDLAYARPALKIPSGQMDSIIGKKANKNYSKGDLIESSGL